MNRGILIAAAIAGGILSIVYVMFKAESALPSAPTPHVEQSIPDTTVSSVPRRNTSSLAIHELQEADEVIADAGAGGPTNLGEPLDISSNFVSVIDVEQRHLGEFIDANALTHAGNDDTESISLGVYMDANAWPDVPDDERSIGELLPVDDRTVVTQADMEGIYVDLGERIPVVLDD